MRFIVVAVFLSSTMTVAAAVGPADCVKLSAASDRLSCFDKIFAAGKRDAGPEKGPEKEVSDSKTGEENTRLNKSICKGCTK